ncbi:MAG: TlpA family protein disulfide reductase [Mangrovibacterium sp.]
MNRFLILTVAICSFLTCGAQNNKNINISLETDTCSQVVQLFRVIDGSYKLVDEFDLKEGTQCTLSDTAARAFYLIKYNNHYTKLYATQGNTVQVKLINNVVEFVKPSKENKVLDAWASLSEEARMLSLCNHLGDREQVLKITPFYDAMRELEAAQGKFLKKVKSSDAYFCEAVEVLVQSEVNYFKLFHPKIPLIAASIKELPADLYEPIRNPNRFSNPIILDVFEHTIPYVQLYGAKCQKEDYLQAKPAVEYAEAPEVRVIYLVTMARYEKDDRGMKRIETRYAELFKEGYALEQLNELKKEFAIRAENAKLSKIELQKVDGSIVKLSDYKGKVIAVDVWATWCAPCMKKRPAFEKLAQEMKDENVVFVCISIDDSEIKWKQVAEQSEGIELLDHKRLFSNAYGISSIPHILIFDAEGNLAESPAAAPGTARLKQEIEQVLSKTK